jgi:hypothetical protein
MRVKVQKGHVIIKNKVPHKSKKEAKNYQTGCCAIWGCEDCPNIKEKII